MGIQEKHHAVIPTVLGDITIVSNSKALTGLYFPNHKYPPTADHLGNKISATDHHILASATQQLKEYLNGKRQVFDIELAPDGNDFNQKVWQMLLEIPYGKTVSYGQLAKKLGNKHLAQRVGSAVGSNPISIFIPCHRVLGADGSLTGYLGGLTTKRFLLTLEETPNENMLF